VIRTGDIGAVKGSGFVPALSNRIILPHTDRYHHFIVGDYLPWEEDWEIFESISKGPTVGRLSWYDGEDIKFMRPPTATEDDGKHAAAECSRYGREHYDFDLFLELGLFITKYELRRLRNCYLPVAIAVEELPFSEDKDAVCTRLAWLAWRWFEPPIIPISSVTKKQIQPIPASFQLALNNGSLILIERL
jgi:hypothetical protein